MSVRRSQLTKLHQSSVEIDELEILELKKYPHSSPIFKLCSICTEEYIKAYSWSIFTCQHNQICIGCLNSYVDHSLQQKNIPKCVAPKCPGQLKINEIDTMYVLTREILIRLKDYVKKEMLKNNKKCTMPDCYGFINNGTCDLCLTNFCENCYNKEHRGQCKIDEIELGENIKRCPQCGMGIQQNGGCLHMTCANCKHEFCFKCRQVWCSRHHVTCGTGESSVFDLIRNFFTRNS